MRTSTSSGSTVTRLASTRTLSGSGLKPGSDDPRTVVRDGYETIAGEYLARVTDSRSGAGVRAQIAGLIEGLASRLPEGGRVLDLGCGAGIPFTRLLAESFEVTGVDFSSAQLEHARQNVPDASFIRADMTTVEFSDSSFDAVTAFFSIIHVPRDHHEDLFRSIGRWLAPGGVFVASLGKRGAAEDWDENWLGARMFWSYHDPQQALRLVEDAGLSIEREWFETIEDGIDGPETFYWLMASKSAD